MTMTNGATDAIVEPLVTAEPSDGAGGDDGGNGNDNGTVSAAAANPMPGNIRAADIVGEMQTAYLDYAMSVIVARALPDVRDGLKPVHRRILYAMSHDLYLTHLKPHRKSARIVGEVLGKYHPHGDVAVYDAMVRMAQEFSLRYPLVDGQGNFGSVDGDGAAAMRYTEARLAEVSELMLADLDKDTVEWHDNFDNSLEEPDVLPAALPNLLINGSSGIAVGMATNIPPHNLGEIVDALVYLIDRYQRVEEITVDELLQFVKGPDFPTGGILYRFREDKADENIDVIAQGYAMGKARLIMQAKAHFEEMSRGRSRIVVTELPYQTNKTALIERIASLARDAKIEGITDLRDESDRTGMRIVVELTRNAEAKDVLKDLFKYTPLQQTFGMQMLALVDGQPRLLSLKRALHLFVQHREVIIRRRSEYDLGKARDRAHIVEGLLKALDILDEVIATIRRSQTVETARNNLVKNFGFSEIQAQAILDMQLRRLAALERKKLKEEYDELLARIAYLEDLLAHPEKILAVIREDLLAQKEKYGDERRTQIVDRTKGTLTTTDLLPQQEVWVTVSADGELRRQDVVRPTVAIMRQMAKHGQVAMLTANTRDWLYLFCRDGRCTRIAVHEIPQNGSPKHVAELSDFTRRDTITAAISLPRINSAAATGYLFLATVLGEVKRVAVADLVGTIAAEFPVIAVTDKDRLGWVIQSQGGHDVMLITAEGQSIRFREEDVRNMGLAAGGVGGIKLKKKDLVVHAQLIDPAREGTVITMTEQGYAKRSELTEYSRQGRNGGGIVTHKPTTRTGLVAAALIVGATTAEEELLAVVTAKHQVLPLTITDVPIMGRGVQGKLVSEIGRNDRVSVIKRISDSTSPTAPNPSGGNGDSPADSPSPESGSGGQSSSTTSNGSGGKVNARATRATPSAKQARTSSTKRAKKVSTAAASTQTPLLDVAAETASNDGRKATKTTTSTQRGARSGTSSRANSRTAPIATEALRLKLVEPNAASASKRGVNTARESAPKAASSAATAKDSADDAPRKRKAKRTTTAKALPAASTETAPAKRTSTRATGQAATNKKPVKKARNGARVNDATLAAAPALLTEEAKGGSKGKGPAAEKRGEQSPEVTKRSQKKKTVCREATTPSQKSGEAPSGRQKGAEERQAVGKGASPAVDGERANRRKSATAAKKSSNTGRNARAEKITRVTSTGRVNRAKGDKTAAGASTKPTRAPKRSTKAETPAPAKSTASSDAAPKRAAKSTSASAKSTKKKLHVATSVVSRKKSS